MYNDSTATEATRLLPEGLPDSRFTATRTSSWINVTNNIIGTGILTMPFAFSKFGLIFGLLLEVAVAVASAAGLYFLLECAFKLKRRNVSYANLSRRTYPSSAPVFDMVVATKCFGLGVGYFIVIGDLMPQILLFFGFAMDSLACSRRFWILIFALVLIPLALLKKLDSLWSLSYVAVGTILFLLVIVVWSFFTSGPILWDRIDLIRMDMGFFAGFPVFIYAFSCHENIFTIYNELLDNRPRNLYLIVAGSIGSSAIIYGTIGIFGYLTYGTTVLPNILAMYEIGPLLTAGRVAVVLLAVVSYPFQSHPCRSVLMKLLGAHDGPQPQEDAHSSAGTKFFFITLLIVLGNCCVALLVQRLDHVLALVGSVGSTSITLVFPAIMFLELDKTLAGSPPHFPNPLQRGAAYCLAALGLVSLILCLSYNISVIAY